MSDRKDTAKHGKVTEQVRKIAPEFDLAIGKMAKATGKKVTGKKKSTEK